MTTLTIDATHEFPALQENLNTLKERLNGDLTPLMQAIGVVLEGSTRQRFADKKSPTGVTWASLAPATIKRKKNKSVSKDGVTVIGTLVERGDLFKSITSHANKDSVSVGTDRKYGIWHQIGIASETKDMPARPFLGISGADKDEVYNIINDYLQGDIHG